ncbi:MAG: hypothetical protein PHO37_06995 [Kiritimatiellae bacterium]|nr:hypothetical protein [Kiritimatiellia bacterium]
MKMFFASKMLSLLHYYFYGNVIKTRFGAAFLLRQGYGATRKAGQQTVCSSRLLFTLQRARCYLAGYLEVIFSMFANAMLAYNSIS